MDGMAENSAEIEKFVQESQDCNFLQEDGSDIPANDNSDALSQGFCDSQMKDCVNTFFGSNFNTSKNIHSINSQYGSSQRQSLSHYSSAQGSKNTLFALKNGQIGDGGMSIKNYIDSSRDLTMVHVGHAAALAAHLRQDGNGTTSSSAIGSKQYISGLTTAQTKTSSGKDSSGLLQGGVS